jgi:hypothetical protein
MSIMNESLESSNTPRMSPLKMFMPLKAMFHCACSHHTLKKLLNYPNPQIRPQTQAL